MTYDEFCTLLSGLMGNTPLGQIIQIRSEEDPERLKSFTPEQKRIRNEWRIKLMNKQDKEVAQMTEEEKQEQIKQVQEMFRKAFSKK